MIVASASPAEGSRTFISYARKDSAFALKIAKDLRAAGAAIWIDQLDIPSGKPWDAAVQEAIERCPCLLVILSPDSMSTANVLDEVRYAVDQGKRVIPVLYRDCKIPYWLRRPQRVDARIDLADLLRVFGAESPEIPPQSWLRRHLLAVVMCTVVAGLIAALGMWWLTSRSRPDRFVFVGNKNDPTLRAYAIDSSGVWASLPTPPGAKEGPWALAVHPNARFLYGVGPGDISVFEIGKAGGLSSHPSAGVGSWSMAFDPKGQFVYVITDSDTISAFKVDAHEGTFEKPGRRFGTGSEPHGVAVDPTGRFVFVANCGFGEGCNGHGFGSISAYSIDRDHAGLNPVSPSPFEAGKNPFSVVVDPSGRFAYSINAGSDNISGYSIHPDTGWLTPIPGSPFPTGIQPQIAVIHPAGFLYVTHMGSQTLSVLEINPITGILTKNGDYQVPCPLAIGLSPDGHSLYAPSHPEVLAYSVNKKTGVLTRTMEGKGFPSNCGDMIALVPAAR